MKFAQVELGKKARRRVSWSTLEGQVVECDVRIVTGAEDQQIMASAMAHVEAVAGEKNAKAGNPIYEFEVAVQGVALFSVDTENPEEKFFASPTEVREKLERDRINYIYDQQQEFQHSLSPLQREMSRNEWAEMVARVAQQAEGDPDPLGTCALSLRRSYDRTTALELLTLLRFRSSSSSQD